MSLRKSQADLISEQLRARNASPTMQAAFAKLAKFVKHLRNQGLCGENVDGDLLKVNAAMLKALSKVAPNGGWVRLEKLAKAYEEFFGTADVIRYSQSNAIRSRIASEILETLGFATKKQGGRNYTMLYVDFGLLEELVAESAVGKPVGALAVHRDVAEFCKS